LTMEIKTDVKGLIIFKSIQVLPSDYSCLKNSTACIKRKCVWTLSECRWGSDLALGTWERQPIKLWCLYVAIFCPKSNLLMHFVFWSSLVCNSFQSKVFTIYLILAVKKNYLLQSNNYKIAIKWCGLLR
jgi:hypothetical protein